MNGKTDKEIKLAFLNIAAGRDEFFKGSWIVPFAQRFIQFTKVGNRDMKIARELDADAEIVERQKAAGLFEMFE